MRQIAMTLIVAIASVSLLADTIWGRTVNNQSLNGFWQGEDLKGAFERVSNVVVLPLGVEHIEGAGFALTFYVGWSSAEPRTYSRMHEIVHDFRGRFTWSILPEFNYRGAFVSVTPSSQIRQSFQGENIAPLSLSDLRREVALFCEYVKSNSTIAHNSPQTGSGGADAEPFEESNYSIFLVAYPERFIGNPTSDADRRLHFGITEDEWLTLTHDEDDTMPAALPFLLKLKERCTSVTVSPEDVPRLYAAFVAAESSTSKTALQGILRKLQRIFAEASARHLGVILKRND